MKLKKIAWFILANLFLFLLFPEKASAGLEFTTKEEINYQVGPRGNAEVSLNISLINNFSNIYLQEYHLKINGIKIKNIVAADSLGSILEEVIEGRETTTIKLKFNQETIGKDKETNFKISYSLPQLALKKGQVWEMTVPGLENIEEIDQLDLKIQVPAAFGGLSYSSIAPKKQEKTSNYQLISFQKPQIGKKALILAFGDFQIFDFSLTFFLDNQEKEFLKTEIPLPPDTGYQSVFFNSIDPEPEKVGLDHDFNWLAEYLIPPKKTITVNLQGQAKIFSQPNNQAFVEAAKNQNLSFYLKNDLYWEVNNPLIKSLSLEHSTPKKIYDFVVSHLEYDFQKLDQSKRIGALAAYQEKKGVCTEFSDLFITLTRAAGIPSRELEGFAFTNNQEIVSLAASNNVLHAWPEYWDSRKQVWTPVDPTWAKTTGGTDFWQSLDLGHFVFVTHGQSSIYPPPPGSYQSPEQKKNIQVQFADNLKPPPEIKLGREFKEDGEGLKIIIKNQALAPSYNNQAVLKGWQGNETKRLEPFFLPPLGEKEIVVHKPSLLKRLFGKPAYQLELNNSLVEINYPKLSFKDFFANLFKK